MKALHLGYHSFFSDFTHQLSSEAFLRGTRYQFNCTGSEVGLLGKCRRIYSCPQHNVAKVGCQNGIATPYPSHRAVCMYSLFLNAVSCVDGQFKLIKNTNYYSFRDYRLVLICSNNRWETITSYYSSSTFMKLVCKEVGLGKQL